MLSKRLKPLIEENVHPGQHAFRQNRGTQTLLLDLEHHIKKEMNKRKHGTIMMLDLEKAFDKVTAFRVITQLLAWKVDRNTVKIILSYLQDRAIRASVNGFLSNKARIDNGIPQGSPLSTDIFLIYVDSLLVSLSTIQDAMNFVYADNIISYTTGTVEQTQVVLQSVCERAITWAKQHGSNIPIEKAEILHCCKKRECPSLSYTLMGRSIEAKDKVKILGLIITKRLKWQDHANYVSEKLLKVHTFIKCIASRKMGASPAALIPIAKALINGLVGYGLLIYGNTTKSAATKVQTQINNILRTATGAFRTTPIELLLLETGLLHFTNRLKKLQANFITRQLTDPAMPLHSIVETLIHCRPSPLKAETSIEISTKMYQNLDVPIPPKFPTNTSKILYSSIHPSKQIDTQMANDNKQNTSTTVLLLKAKELIHLKYHNHEKIYTDGSKTLNGTGFSVITHKNGEHEIAQKIRLNNNCDVYSAELTAILFATTINRESLAQKVIFTDSLSAVHAIGSPENKEYMLRRIRQELHKTNSVVCWIPGHCGIQGNELADVVAKQAANDPSIKEVTPHLTNFMLKTALKNIYLRRNEQLQHVQKQYVIINPNMAAPLLNPELPRNKQVTLIRLRLGHCNLTHIHIIKRTPPPMCEFCNQSLTVLHLLKHCPKTKTFLGNNLQNFEYDVQQLIKPSSDKDATIFKLLTYLKYDKRI